MADTGIKPTYNGAPTSQRLLTALDAAITKLEQTELAKAEPIAIVGMSCRFPGGANSPDAFWQLLREGREGISEVPAERWSLEQYYDPDSTAAGKMYSRWGGFLTGIDQFDPQFFGISPREATQIDPQQRLLLETAWEALEGAGALANAKLLKDTGVFVGITTNDYARLLTPEGNCEQIDAYYLTGNPLNAVAGRLAYTLGLQGPCMAIDTACSSSLVAVHQACQSLRQGECHQAIAGGVNLMLSPENTIALCKAKILADDGPAKSQCKTFDANANGIVRGEGCGVIVLKRLSQALADGDPILAMIRSSAINQDGASGGFTVPNRSAQEDLLRRVLDQARLAPADIDYIEAHGTGTPLGDPIEVRALAAILGAGRPAERPLLIGSVKTNIGHLESAAGIAGLIKVVLAIQHREIPPHLHLQTPNPYINWQDLPVAVPRQVTSWPTTHRALRAGVSAFGASGTNAHVLLESPPPAQEPAKPEPAVSPALLVLSAKTPVALKALAAAYQTWLSHTSASMPAIAWSSAISRAHFPHRIAICADSPSQAAAQLQTFLVGDTDTGILSGSSVNCNPEIAQLFTGQGSQYAGMGQQLYAQYPAFRAALDECDAILQPLLGRSIFDLPSEILDQTGYTQPTLFALEYALHQLWKSWGISPTVVMGHSVGEYVAACVAGVFSLADGLKLIAARGKLMQALPQGGGMMAVQTGLEKIQARLAEFPHVAIAAINGPTSIVVSGPLTDLASLAEQLNQQGIKTKTLTVSHAFHSPLMQPMLAAFRTVAEQIQFQPPELKLISNLTGQVAGAEIASPDYWCKHILQPVRFAEGMQTLSSLGIEQMLEIGPKPILLGMGRQCVAENPNQTWLPSLRPGVAESEQMLLSLGTLFTRGIAINWANLLSAQKRVSLPTYPFQRQRYWVEPPVRRPKRYLETTSHPLLGTPIPLADSPEYRFQTEISATQPEFLAHHRIFGQVILPATAYFEIALAAAKQISPNCTNSQPNYQLSGVTIHQALLLTEPQHSLQTLLQPQPEGEYRFQIFSQAEQGWVLHASGQIVAAQLIPEILADNPLTTTSQDLSWQAAAYYSQLQARGFEYGPSFQGITALQTEPDLWGEITLPEPWAKGADTYHCHPALLDACLQMLASQMEAESSQGVYLPTGLGRLTLYTEHLSAQLYAQVTSLTGDPNRQLQADLRLWNRAGELLAEIEAATFRRVSRASFEQMLERTLPKPKPETAPVPDWQNWLYEINWEIQPLEQIPEAHSFDGWLILAESEPQGKILVEALTKDSVPIHLISPNAEDWQTGLANLEQGRWGVVYLSNLQPGSSFDPHFSTCQTLLNFLQSVDKSPARKSAIQRLWLVSASSQAVGGGLGGNESGQLQVADLWGMARVVALEYPELHCTRIDLDASLAGTAQVADLVAELQGHAPEDQIAYRHGQRYLARLQRLNTALDSLTIPAIPYRVSLSDYGVFENLQLLPDLIKREPIPEQQVEIEVRAVGLNFRDVLNALGMLRSHTETLGIHQAADLPFGGECAGIVTAVGAQVQHLKVGDAVIAAQTIGSLASYVQVPAAFVVPKPVGLSFAEAATLPTAYLTATYGLLYLAKLQPGERVLIHAAAGGVGQAAVQIAQSLGAEVYATAHPSKWSALRQMGVQHLFNSRTLEFAEQIQTLTQGQGVDVVLNSLNGEVIAKNLQVLAKGGRFVEIGKLGILSPEECQAQRSDVAYFPFDLLDISLADPNLIQDLLAEVISAYQQGQLAPLPKRVFPVQATVAAFRYMAQSKHVGKVVITLPPPASVRANSTYLITGGTGALGLKLASWLASQGAESLVLTSRRPQAELPQSSQTLLENLRLSGTEIRVVPVNVADGAAVQTLLTEIATDLPPLRGVIHAAGVLADGLLSGQTWERFTQVRAAKVLGSWHLHQLTQGVDLDFFVYFSSISALIGSPGQGNYAAANAFMDGLAHYRSQLGLPATSINWGPWGEAGMAANLTAADQQRWQRLGVSPIPTEVGLEILADLLRQQPVQAGVLPVNWGQFLAQMPKSPFLQSFQTVAQPTSQPQFRQELAAAPLQQRLSLLQHHVQTQVAKVLGLPTPELQLQQGFADLGLDSLMGVELRNRLQTSLGCEVPAAVAYDYPTVAALSEYLLAQLFPSEPLAPPVPPSASSPPASRDVNHDVSQQEIHQLSEAEAEARLLSQLDQLGY